MSYKDIPVGSDAPAKVYAVVEMPKGQMGNKYEYYEEYDTIFLDRVEQNMLSNSIGVDYGFIPQTRSEDGDHLDVLIMSRYPLHVGITAEVRVLGVMNMVDDGENDHKIIAVIDSDKYYDALQEFSDIPAHLIRELEYTFLHYKDLRKGTDSVQINVWGDRQEAYRVINNAIAAEASGAVK